MVNILPRNRRVAPVDPRYGEVVRHAISDGAECDGHTSGSDFLIGAVGAGIANVPPFRGLDVPAAAYGGRECALRVAGYGTDGERCGGDDGGVEGCGGCGFHGAAGCGHPVMDVTVLEMPTG